MREGRRYAVTYADDIFSTLIPNHQNARLMGDWLQNDAFVLAQDQNYDAALESCQALLNAGHVYKDETFLITLLKSASPCRTYAVNGTIESASWPKGSRAMRRCA